VYFFLNFSVLFFSTTLGNSKRLALLNNFHENRKEKKTENNSTKNNRGTLIFDIQRRSQFGESAIFAFSSHTQSYAILSIIHSSLYFNSGNKDPYT